MTEPAVFSLGSNLGDRLGFLQQGVDTLTELLGRLRVSPVVETDPAGGAGGPTYLNAVVTGAVADPAAALDAVREAERRAGRVRVERWGPRTLDVDVITIGSRRSDDPRLLLPHPRAHERLFVLLPWHALDPDAELPDHGPVARLLPTGSAPGVRARPDLRLVAR